MIRDVWDFVLEVYFVCFYDATILYSLGFFRYLIRCVVPILEVNSSFAKAGFSCFLKRQYTSLFLKFL